MGKILIIQGADFSKYKVESIKFPYTGPVEIPQISIDSETLLCTLIANENLDIFYTTDGSDPSVDSNYYTEPFEITNQATIKAITHNYKTVSELPKITATVNIDDIDLNTTLELSSSVEGIIRYTIDGSEPSLTSTEYTEAIEISSEQTYKIAVYKGSSLVSEISTIQIIDWLLWQKIN